MYHVGRDSLPEARERLQVALDAVRALANTTGSGDDTNTGSNDCAEAIALAEAELVTTSCSDLRIEEAEAAPATAAVDTPASNGEPCTVPAVAVSGAAEDRLRNL